LKDKLKKLAEYMDDILFTLGVIFLSLGGFLICIQVGFFILGVCCIAYAFIFAKFTGKARR
jgi:Ca2+/Na+ antiporter